MLTAISYGDENFSQSLRFNLWTAKVFGKAEKTIKYGPSDIDESFKQKNNKILSNKKGAGYWLWKPYVIYKTIETINFDDYLVYADSGSFYMNNINLLIDEMNSRHLDVYLSVLKHIEATYSKRDAFVYMDVDGLGFEKTPQIEASFIIIKKTESTKRFVKEWLDYCCDERIISDNENVCGFENFNGFIENRYDQTVLSLLSKKYGYPSSNNVEIPEPAFTFIDPLLMFGKGRYKEYYYDLSKREEAIDRWKTERFLRAFIVRTRFRNMFYPMFCLKTCGKVLRYLYRNYMAYFFTKIYVYSHK